MAIPLRYVPRSLSRKDTKRQKQMLKKSRSPQLRIWNAQSATPCSLITADEVGVLSEQRCKYQKGKYFTRKKLGSFHSRPSGHVLRAKHIYGVQQVVPNAALSKATGCSIGALQEIVRKGQGAYYSSGSRPNQTATSWGLARLASAITSGKAAAIDYAILKKGCHAKSRALKFAKKTRKNRIL